VKLKLLTGSLVLVAASAFAVSHAGSPADYFTKMDTDASGMVSEAEYVAYKTSGGKYTAEKAAASFVKMAGDDSQISLSEMENAMMASKKKPDCNKKNARTT